MKSDLHIAREAKRVRVTEIAGGLDVPESALHMYGKYKAKVDARYCQSLGDRPDGKLILVTAMSPTPMGEGKTATSVGLADGLRHIGKRSALCLREPSLGPVFGMKGVPGCTRCQFFVSGLQVSSVQTRSVP